MQQKSRKNKNEMQKNIFLSCASSKGKRYKNNNSCVHVRNFLTLPPVPQKNGLCVDTKIKVFFFIIFRYAYQNGLKRMILRDF